ncbi:hypothetical protein L249_3384, partial [Ophiocordyceps polyrhachis-furcata BCC 54312]
AKAESGVDELWNSIPSFAGAFRLEGEFPQTIFRSCGVSSTVLFDERRRDSTRGDQKLGAWAEMKEGGGGRRGEGRRERGGCEKLKKKKKKKKRRKEGRKEGEEGKKNGKEKEKLRRRWEGWGGGGYFF